MWIFTLIASGDRFYVLNEKAEYVVGRAGSDLCLKDNSVSRSHAKLHVAPDEDNGLPVLAVEDLGSKYGSYCNAGIETKERLEQGERLRLRHGDRVRFGLLTSVFTVAHQPLVALATRLSAKEQLQYERCIGALGGRMLAEWQEGCGATHLTISDENSFSPTLKLIQALLHDVRLVTSDFWMDLLHACKRSAGQLPKAEDYVPSALQQCGEYKLEARYYAERRRLFSGLTFVFINATQYKTYAGIVASAGGSTRELSKGVAKSFLIKDNVLTVEYIPGTQTQSSQTVSNILEYLQSHSRRLIPEYEIGLAILTCSTSKYCNAGYNLVQDLMPESQITTDTGMPITTELLPPTEVLPSRRPNARDLAHIPSTIPDSAVDEELPPSVAGKRKQVLRVLDSDEEASSDDDVPLARQKKKKPSDEDSPRGGRSHRSAAKYSTEGLEKPKESTEGLRRSTRGVKDSTGGLKESTGGLKESTAGVKDSTGGVKDSTRGVKESTGGLKDSTRGVKEPTGGLKDSTRPLKDSSPVGKRKVSPKNNIQPGAKDSPPPRALRSKRKIVISDSESDSESLAAPAKTASKRQCLIVESQNPFDVEVGDEADEDHNKNSIRSLKDSSPLGKGKISPKGTMKNVPKDSPPPQALRSKRKAAISGSESDSEPFAAKASISSKRARPILESENPFSVGVVGEADDDDDEDDLFLSAKEPTRASQRRRSAASQQKSPASASKPKALPIFVETQGTRKPKATTDLTSFLEKTQRFGGNTQSQPEEASPAAAKAPRPLRIAVLGEGDDDDDDDMFSFGMPSSSKSGSNNNKKATAAKGIICVESQRPSKAAPSQPPAPAPAQPTKDAPASFVPQPKPLPKTLNVSCWLSCGLQAVKIEKSDPDASVDAGEVSVKQELDGADDWVRAISHAISVKPLDTSLLKVLKPQPNDSLASSALGGGDESSVTLAGGKNFKRFTKRPTLCHAAERQLIRTISVRAGKQPGEAF